MIREEHQGSEQQNSSVYAGYRSDNQPEYEGQTQLDDREMGKENGPCPQLPLQSESKANPIDPRQGQVCKRDGAQERKDTDDKDLTPVHPNDRGKRPMLEECS